jgi:hypothetical protein
LFHLTAEGNLNGILRERTLFPAATLLSVNGRIMPRLTPRLQHLQVERDGQWIWIRDQQPLHEGNIAFEEGWDMPRFLDHIGAHVFFWPGTAGGPVKAGLSHFAQYAKKERLGLLRIPTIELLGENAGLTPLFSRFNSGAPRWNRGQKGPRGASTFVPASDSSCLPGEVVELVFPGPVRLPRTAEGASSYAGPWTPLLA